MSKPQEALDAPELVAFVTAMQKLHRDADGPASRTIGRETGLSHTSVNGLFNGTNFGSLRLFTTVVRYLGGDVEEFKTLRQAAIDATANRPLRDARSLNPGVRATVDHHRRAFNILARLTAALTWEHLQVRLPFEALDGQALFSLHEDLSEASRWVMEIRVLAARLSTLAAGPHAGGLNGYLMEVRGIQRSLDQATDELAEHLAAAQRVLAALPTMFVADPG